MQQLYTVKVFLFDLIVVTTLHTESCLIFCSCCFVTRLTLANECECRLCTYCMCVCVCLNFALYHICVHVSPLLSFISTSVCVCVYFFKCQDNTLAFVSEHHQTALPHRS